MVSGQTTSLVCILKHPDPSDLTVPGSKLSTMKKLYIPTLHTSETNFQKI